MVDFTGLSLGSIKDNAAQWLLHASSFLGAFGPSALQDPGSSCTALQGLHSIQNTTILSAVYYTEPVTAIPLQIVQSCYYRFQSINTSVPLCRVQFGVNTSETSEIKAEAWLPDEWNGRFLALGNGGLGGCVDYPNLSYGSSLGFAAVGSNNGHDGNTGEFFVNNPEVLNDFTHRSIHTEQLVGKQLVREYYGKPHKKSYYMGCSTGGRQGVLSALRYPEDFDGILAGAPATNFVALQGAYATMSQYVGAPNATGKANPSFISTELWEVVTQEILNQCDELDGVKDGIITEPDGCDFRPEQLLCDGSWWSAKKCLTPAQVEALNRIYQPIFGSDGRLLFPRFDPGAEAEPLSQKAIFSGEIFPYAEQWFKLVIFNDSNYDFDSFGVKDIEYGVSMDPGGLSAFSGDMSAFKARGGKLLTYHGRRDELIPSGNAKALYNLISRTLNMPTLDSFYRLFLIPGMGHCAYGLGASNFGQLNAARGPEATRDLPSHNILLALVEWVEKGKAPDVIVGTSSSGEERKHCRYPWRSIWDKTALKFDCVL
ncbi:tannase and feruloyl esterase [Schizopora paradoxa]|uniref:Carboxylic ester hydrolase n=1 Tax=Schizopora paradoxa TaxID=27342 RepID=A0A0H2SDU8_9AGAM|nr:tannase and feruloyl esterase [Schizopora paradoxa]